MAENIRLETGRSTHPHVANVDNAMPPPSRLTTRVLLTCAALAAVHVLLHLATVPLLTALAPVSPPLYGLVAGVHSVMPFLARRLTAVPGSATITAGIVCIFAITSSPSGIIVAIPLMLVGATIDLVVWRADEARSSRSLEVRYVLAAVVAGSALFAVSLSVFSPEHLSPPLVIATLITRVLGVVTALMIARVVDRSLKRAGVGLARRVSPRGER